MTLQKNIAIIGGGWAGLAAAVETVRLGHRATLYEMAPQLGGRARQIDSNGIALDNGQHILIGAYAKTLELMEHVGVDAKRALLRVPLRIAYPDGKGLQLGPGHPVLAFIKAVVGHTGWKPADKWALLKTTGLWSLGRFRCPPELTVQQLTRRLPRAVRTDLIEPLCVAALNTSATAASASVFLRVLHDALFSGRGSADLLLPRWRLSALWPEPASAWLKARAATLLLSQRVERLTRQSAQWQVDGQTHDGVVVACTAVEAARLVEPHAPSWSAQARALPYEPITTVYAHSPETRLPEQMMALRADAHSPAQFVFDLGAIGGMDGVLAFVISAAAPWVDRGSDATMAATLRQGQRALAGLLASPLVGMRCLTEKRATFLCVPALQRPEQTILPGLAAAGDYVSGPYPASLEGAVRSGTEAVLHLLKSP